MTALPRVGQFVYNSRMQFVGEVGFVGSSTFTLFFNASHRRGAIGWPTQNVTGSSYKGYALGWNLSQPELSDCELVAELSIPPSKVLKTMSWLKR